jgi:hypothetical protein
MDEVANLAEEAHGGPVQIDVPSLGDKPIPLRDALNIVGELRIALDKAERQATSFDCWYCNFPITIEHEQYGKTVRCSKCGQEQRAHRPAEGRGPIGVEK